MPNTAATVNHFVTWAWGVKNNLILPTTYFIDPNDVDCDNYHTLRHQTCIILTTLPTGTPTVAPAAAAPAGIAHPGEFHPTSMHHRHQQSHLPPSLQRGGTMPSYIN